MENPNYNYYEIDLTDIWGYEREQYLTGLSSEKYARDLLEVIQHNIIKYAKPNFGISLYDKGDADGKAYYARNIRDYNNNIGDLSHLYRLDYFINGDDCYDYDHEIIVNIKDVDFPYFFSLKLRQYTGNLFELNNFLKFQLKRSFKNKIVEYKEFLSLLLLQYSAFFPESIKKLIIDFENLKKEKSKPIKSEKPIDKYKTTEKNIPESKKITPTRWQYALFYVYIISSKEHKKLGEIAKLKKDAFAKIAGEHKLSPKAFEQHFRFYDNENNRNGKTKSEKRTFKTIRDDIQFVFNNMLTNYPKALALAQIDLNQIVTKM